MSVRSVYSVALCIATSALFVGFPLPPRCASAADPRDVPPVDLGLRNNNILGPTSRKVGPFEAKWREKFANTATDKATEMAHDKATDKPEKHRPNTYVQVKTVLHDVDLDQAPIPPSEPAQKRDLPPARSSTPVAPHFNVDPTPSAGPLPADASANLFVPLEREQRTRGWSEKVANWQASNVYHQPLYFEDVPLERYGQGRDLLQPFVSGGRFLVNLAALPYQFAVDGPFERVYAFGYYRPGSPTPCIRQTLPLEADAVTAEVATILALAFLLP